MDADNPPRNTLSQYAEAISIVVAILVSRVLEDYAVTDDPDQSIITGLTNTGKVILSAAVIMGSVFFVFVTNPSPVVKMIGFGWALAYSPTR
ncbi:MAG: MMPL family transporter [Ilumatobacteraceae bacterium]|nr:MMPL family transporter [Ilumatobacteraceae bacterium]